MKISFIINFYFDLFFFLENPANNFVKIWKQIGIVFKNMPPDVHKSVYRCEQLVKLPLTISQSKSFAVSRFTDQIKFKICIKPLRSIAF